MSKAPVSRTTGQGKAQVSPQFVDKKWGVDANNDVFVISEPDDKNDPENCGIMNIGKIDKQVNFTTKLRLTNGQTICAAQITIRSPNHNSSSSLGSEFISGRYSFNENNFVNITKYNKDIISAKGLVDNYKAARQDNKLGKQGSWIKSYVSAIPQPTEVDFDPNTHILSNLHAPSSDAFGSPNSCNMGYTDLDTQNLLATTDEMSQSFSVGYLPESQVSEVSATPQTTQPVTNIQQQVPSPANVPRPTNQKRRLSGMYIYIYIKIHTMT